MASNVAALVVEMSDTLSAIRQTMDALSDTTHSSRLDQLEHQRDSTLAALRANFERETEDLGAKRRKEREDIAERRRKEDEEIRERRRREDEDIGLRDEREDGERETKFVGEMDDVEDELDGLMEGVEAEAEAFITDGRDKLARLEERRKELNRLIDEQVQVPLPTVPTRRRSRGQRAAGAAITSKPVPTRDTAMELVSNNLKATKVAYDDVGAAAAAEPPQLAGRGDGGSEGGGDDVGSAASGDVVRGSFESGRTARSRVGSVSSLQRGSRISAFGWFAGKIGLGEVRNDDAPTRVVESPDTLGRDEDVSVVIREIPGNLSDHPVRIEEAAADRLATKDDGSDDLPQRLESIPSNIVSSSEVNIGNGNAEGLPTAPEDRSPGYGKNEPENADQILEPRTFSYHENINMPSSDPRDPNELPHGTSGTNDGAPEVSSLHDAPGQYGLSHGGESHEPDSASYGHTSETGSHNDGSRASSREGSYVGTAPAGSETTLDVGYEPYSGEGIERVHEKGSHREMDDELGDAEDIGAEISRAEYDERLNQESYESQLGTDSPEINDTAIPGEMLGQAVYHEQFATTHALSRDAAAFEEGKNALDRDHVVFGNYDNADADDGAYSDVDDASESASDVALDQILTVPSQPRTPEVVGAPEVPESQAAVFHDAESEDDGELNAEESELERGAELGSELVDATGIPESHEVASSDIEVSESDRERDGDDSSSLGRGVEEEALVSSYAEEVMDSTDSRTLEALDAAFDTDAAANVSEIEADELATDGQLGEESAAPDTLQLYLPVELPPHAMEYSSGPESAQLPDGTWSIGQVDEELYKSLVARFMVPATLAANTDTQDDAILAAPSLRSEEAFDYIPSDSFDAAVESPKEESRDDNDRDFDYSSFAHDVQPASIQLGSGVWSVDPSDDELEAAALEARELSAHLMAEPHQVPVDNLEEAAVGMDVGTDTGILRDGLPASTQLPNGVWVVDPSERDYEISVPLVRGDSPTEHDTWVDDGPSSPTISHHNLSEERGLPYAVEAVHSPVKADPPSLEVNHSPLQTIFSPEEMAQSPMEPVTSPVDAGHLRGIEESPGDAKDTTSFYQEHEGTSSKAEMGDQWTTQEDTLSLRAAESQSGRESPDLMSQETGPQAPQVETQEAATLPWSPFNNKIPLSPETSPEDSVRAPSLEETHEGEMSVDTETTQLRNRHATFGYEREGQVPVSDDVYSEPSLPTSFHNHTDKLNVAEVTTDTESQAFVTPLQSAGIHTPPQFQEQPDLFHNAVDYARSDTAPEENATTVHGHDELFDLDDESDYEPDVSVDENGEPLPNLGVPPQHLSYDLGHSAETPSDTPTAAALHAEVETKSPRPTQNPPEAQLAQEPEDNSDVSPLYLREHSPEPATPRRGLAFSRHNPERPVTPPSQTIPEYTESPEASWDASGRIDSTPMSLVSHSTLSSSPGSPTRDILPLESYEPSMQGSWPTRIRNLSEVQNPHHDYEGGFHDHEPAEDSKVLEEGLPTPIATRMPSTYHPSPSPAPSPATPSPSSLISRMRGMFEKPVDSTSPRSRPSSSVYNGSRPSSGVFNGSRPQSGVFAAQRAPESPGYDVPGEPRKGGFLNEIEDEVDERSALLGAGRV
ncbi:uncharacterized protein DNG_04123 [Cephalotrichum gorgonifer]|uniref:Uncharacterized protein n=1 Tax=Cephalotrichum gorgonifer TaxID=2041049 RepID=A0AAE8MVG7_9PEZI|nr:uncharacterized protein DNG_04123 [Cephalotrichum gorgonifer]